MDARVTALGELIGNRNGRAVWRHVQADLFEAGLRPGLMFADDDSGGMFMEVIDRAEQTVIGAMVLQWASG